jgi:hypothetical protein
VPTSNYPSWESVVEAVAVAVAVCALPQAVIVNTRLITIETNIHFFILISFQVAKAFIARADSFRARLWTIPANENPFTLILHRISFGCLDFV